MSGARPPRPAVVVLLAVCCLLALVYFLLPSTSRHIIQPSTTPAKSVVPSTPVHPTSASRPTPASAAAITIVLDDFGASWVDVDRCLALPNAVVIAVIPHLRDSVKVAREASARGFDVILHQPMEPHTFPKEDPGKYGVYTGQSAEEVSAILGENLSSLGIAPVGVNNHMGSKATESEETMRIFFDAFPRDLIFLDSRTSEKSVAYDVARSLGIRALKNNVFLDNVHDSEGIGKNFDMLIRMARSRGHALAIGHVYSSTLLDVLEARLPPLSESGVRLARLSEIAE